MNYWKKIAFVLALVAGLCGGAWARNHDRDRDWRYHNNPNYQYRWGGSYGYYPYGAYRYYPYGRYYRYPNSTWGYGGRYDGHANRSYGAGRDYGRGR